MMWKRLSLCGAIMLWASLALTGCSDDEAGKVSSCTQLNCEAEQRVCTSTGGKASCGNCRDGFAEEDGRCREAKFCVALDCAAQQRTCEEAAGGQDAVCGDCRAGFVDNGDGACVADVNATCDPEGPDSIAARCQAEHRECVEDDAGLATCSGPCLAGFKAADPDDATSACVPVKTCADIQATCDGVCVPHEHQDAECVENPCAPNEAFIPGAPAAEACVACNFEGVTGCTDRNFTRASGADECVCVTEKGYFWNPNRFPVAGPELCDKDGDGWVDKRAADFYTDPNGDPTLKEAANCDFQVIDRFILKNDIPNNAAREVTIAELTGGSMATVVLQESVRNDDAAHLQAAYGAGELPLFNGRALPAAALNSLTKACANALADFNDNGQRDLTEFQPAGLASDPAGIFARMSYFMMLVDGRFEASADEGAPGRYVITERLRGGDLPLTYAADAGDFWQSCARFPDAIYKDANVSKKVGTDFARYSTPPSNHLITNANAWQGMNHNSQFKCINIVATEPSQEADKGPHVVLLAGLNAADSGYTVNRCSFDGQIDTPDDANPSTPRFSCAPVAPGSVEPGVSWASVNYIRGPYSDARALHAPPPGSYTYARGCADMCAVWRAPACTGFSENPADDSGKCYADPHDFGKQYCGCSMTYGGPGCDYGCASIEQVFSSPGYNPGRRDGKYWACGAFTGSYMPTPFAEPDDEDQHGYRVRGAVLPGMSREDSVLQNTCDQPGCRTYRVR